MRNNNKQSHKTFPEDSLKSTFEVNLRSSWRQSSGFVNGEYIEKIEKRTHFRLQFDSKFESTISHFKEIIRLILKEEYYPSAALSLLLVYQNQIPNIHYFLSKNEMYSILLGKSLRKSLTNVK